MKTCPPVEELQDLLAEALPAPERSSLETHIEHCPQCQQVLDQLTEDSQFALASPVDVAVPTPLLGLRGRQARHAGPSLADTDDPENAAVTRKELPSPLAFLAAATRPNALGRLAHYEVLEVLGQGGFGIVLRAFDDKLQRVVALKVMAGHTASDPTARERFLREARAGAAVRDPHVVQVFEVAESPLPYLVMEYVPGPTLRQEIEQKGAHDVPTIVRVGAQTALGLAATHAQGKIHRDIKPANILLRKDEEGPSSFQVKITDFGLAREVGDVRLTQSGMITGTPLYMSPEQARGEPVDPRSDLFSLGGVLYTLCTGEPAFAADRTLGVLQRVCEGTPRPIREINPKIPDWLEAVVGKLLAKDPAVRFQSAADVADLLGRYQVHLADPSLPQPVVPPAGRAASADRPARAETSDQVPAARAALSRPRGRWLAVGAVAVVSLVLGFLAGYGARPAPAVTDGKPSENTDPTVGPQQQARALLEQSLAEQPGNAAVAGALAELLLAEPLRPGDGGPPAEVEALRAKVRKAGLGGFAALGAARFVRGDTAGAAEDLTRAVEADADAGTAAWLLLALAEKERKRTGPAQQAYEKAMKGISRRPLDSLATWLARRAMVEIEGLSAPAADSRLRTWADAHELAELTVNLGSGPTEAEAYGTRAAWFACRGRWKEAARDRVMQTELDPRDLYAWLWAGALLLLADDPDGYGKLCNRMTPLIDTPLSLWDTEVVCKVWLLHPGKLDGVKGALQRLQKAVKENDGEDWLQPWLAATQALAAYRAGDYAQTVQDSDRAHVLSGARPLGPGDQSVDPGDRSAALTAMVFVVRAMAEQRTNRPGEAKRYYNAASALIPRELRTLGSPAYQGPLPVDANVVDRDWLIAEILRREAERALAGGLQK